MTVVLESLFLGLSTGYIISRAIMLIGLSCIYVSRVDTPFLAEGVGFGLDKYPTAFRTDILLHEAVSLVIRLKEHPLWTPSSVV